LAMTEDFLVHTSHLGDILVSTNIIYNFAMQNGFVAAVRFSKPEIGSALLRVFDYGVHLVEGGSGGLLRHGLTFEEFVPGVRGLSAYWSGTRFASMTVRPRMLTGFSLPAPRVACEGSGCYQVCQFDSSSPKSYKRSLSVEEVDAVVKRFDRGGSIHIGKVGCSAYAGRLGTHYSDIERQACFVLCSDSFFGIDSGMSHLAGSLGKGGDVIVQTEHEGFASCVRTMYGFMYPKLVLHDRRDIQPR